MRNHVSVGIQCLESWRRGNGAQQIQASVGEQAFAAGRYKEARELFAQVALADDFVDFLTLPAYERLAG